MDRKAAVGVRARGPLTEEAWRHWLGEQLYYFMLIDRFRPVGTGSTSCLRCSRGGDVAPRRAPSHRALHELSTCGTRAQTPS